MNFNTLEKEIEQLNRIDIRANYTSRDRYCRLYNSIYENLLEMEKDDLISVESGSKGLGYLRELVTMMVRSLAIQLFSGKRIEV